MNIEDSKDTIVPQYFLLYYLNVLGIAFLDKTEVKTSSFFYF